MCGRGLGVHNSNFPHRGGAKRVNRRPPYYPHPLTKPSIRRLARRGGVKRISGLMCEEVRVALRIYLEDVVRDAILHTESGWRSTLSSADVVHAIRRSGKCLYGCAT
ncbi:hypothetical protein C8R43DRAFT_497604 [Mycena crocata]|nr:hypothetical protein C8R43DRAFT_497604 [Mycena crocata]